MTMDAEKAYRVLAAAFDQVRLVLDGRCPNCGAEREDDDCRTCGWHSVYVKPLDPPAGHRTP